MIEHRQLQRAVFLIGIGYVFLHADLTLGINLLPDGVGYLLQFLALPVLASEEPEAALLKPLALLLCGWGMIQWISAPLGWNPDVYVIQVILNVLALYFHFQLLTNLASVAKAHQCPEHTKILHLRTGRTLLSTLAILPLPGKVFPVILLVLYLLVVLWICLVLFSLHRTLSE